MLEKMSKGISNNDLNNNRIKNSFRIVVVSVIQTIFVSVVPFLIRSLMITNLGENYAGLNSVLVSIMSVINLTEFGLSGAIVYFLYEPLAMNDKSKVEAYLAFIKKIYAYTAAITFVIGLLLIPFLPLLSAKDSINYYDLIFSYIAYSIF